MVVAVCQFVQHHPWLGDSPCEEIFGVGDLDTARLFGIETVLTKPFLARMVAHTRMSFVLVFNPDRYITEFVKGLFGHNTGDSVKVTDLSVTYISNGAYAEQVAASGLWAGGPDAVTLNAGGVPAAGELSLKADDSLELSNAQPVTASPTYVTVDNSNAQTDELGDAVTTNTLWFRFGSPFVGDAFSGTVYYGIAK